MLYKSFASWSIYFKNNKRIIKNVVTSEKNNLGWRPAIRKKKGEGLQNKIYHIQARTPDPPAPSLTYFIVNTLSQMCADHNF